MSRRVLGAGFAALTLLASPHPVAAESSASDYVNRVLELTNAERAHFGLQPVVLNPQLEAAASQYAYVLASTGCFGHNCGPQPDMVQRVESAGYVNWTTVGENIAGGQPSAEAVVDGWMNSAPHRANILNGDYTEMGIGFAAVDANYGTYWTEDFGARASDDY